MPDNRYVRFEDDGTVSIMTGKVELGQGITTALAQIAADELGIDISRIRMIPASTAFQTLAGSFRLSMTARSKNSGGKGRWIVLS